MKTALLALGALCLSLARLQAQPAGSLRIPGTACSIAAPAGYAPAAAFSGFQNSATGGFIMINEVPAPVATVTAGFDEKALRRNGMTLIGTEQTTANEVPATLLTVTQQSQGKVFMKYLLVFGRGSSTTLITAGYPEGAAEDAAALKASIRTISCDTALVVDPLEAVPFTLNTEGTEFKPVRFAGGNLLYSTDGKVPTDKPVLIAGSSHGKTGIGTRRSFAEARLKKLPGAEKATIMRSDEIMIDSLPGYEVIAGGAGSDGAAALFYEVVLFTEDGRYFLIVGQAAESPEALIETYRKIARSFKRKQA